MYEPSKSASILPSESEKKDGAWSHPTVEVLNNIGDSAINTHQVHLKDIDDAAALVAGFQGEITEEQSRRVRRKIDLQLLPLM